MCVLEDTRIQCTCKSLVSSGVRGLRVRTARTAHQSTQHTSHKLTTVIDKCPNNATFLHELYIASSNWPVSFDLRHSRHDITPLDPSTVEDNDVHLKCFARGDCAWSQGKKQQGKNYELGRPRNQKYSTSHVSIKRANCDSPNSIYILSIGQLARKPTSMQ